VEWAEPGSGCVLWFIRALSVPLALIGICLIGVLMVKILWAAQGTDHVGSATKIWTTHGSKGSTHFNVAYTYPLAGAVRSGRSSVSYPEYKRLSSLRVPGAPVTVRVLIVRRYHYEAVYQGRGQAIGDIALFAFFVSLWGVAQAVHAYSAFIEPRRKRRLYEWGVPEPGLITGKRATGGKSPSYYLQYEFAGPDGEVQSAEDTITWEAYQGATVGAAVTVLHFEGKMKPSVVYEYGGYRVVGP
jgi:hypothetical protein